MQYFALVRYILSKQLYSDNDPILIVAKASATTDVPLGST
jgi:hypothetical protein